MSRLLLKALIVLLLCPPILAQAATLPAGFAETLVASGIASPTAMEFAPDGRLFVCEQTGKLRVIKNGILLATEFLSVPVDSSGERGLLGIAFDPNFATSPNKYIYVYYTATTPTIHNRISRFTANGDVAVPGSEFIVLDLNDLSTATNHNGGAVHFGPDGKLYAAVGENANGSNSQTLSNLLGKMLRINSDGTIPSTNPFYNIATGNNRAIWALGLRNPFTFAFQPGTGRMFINDVGQNTWEEINDGIAGNNYGWPNAEGVASCSTYTCPLFAYAHGSTNTTGCAITGGSFYNPVIEQFPADYVGKYFFADYCTGWIRRFDPATNTATGFATGIASPVDLKVSTDGSLYYLSHGGSVYRVQYTANQAPTISTQPVDQTVSVGQSATFSVTASGTAPLSYQWQRNSVNISGANSSSYTLTAQLADNGALFRCIVTNAFGSATSNQAKLTVVANLAPKATITQPANNSLYSAGEVISYSGTGTDPEDGNLPPSAFTWEVVFHHDTHTHPFIQPFSGVTSGTFQIPNTGETSANVWYRIHLTVTDSGGMSNSTYVDILPRKVTITLTTKPSGLQLKLDSIPVNAPYSFVGVVGMLRTIEAVTPQIKSGKSWNFISWSDGGTASHTITTPTANKTYTATYRHN